MATARSVEKIPGGGLLHPVIFAAVALLVVNDHALKGWAAASADPLARAIVGKLSDFAGLLFFPLCLQAVVELLAGRWWPVLAKPRHDVLVAAAVATAVVFAAVKLDAGAAAAYVAAVESILGAHGVHHTMDPWDLIALPMVAVSIALGWRRIDS